MEDHRRALRPLGFRPTRLSTSRPGFPLSPPTCANRASVELAGETDLELETLPDEWSPSSDIVDIEAYISALSNPCTEFRWIEETCNKPCLNDELGVDPYRKEHRILPPIGSGSGGSGGPAQSRELSLGTDVMHGIF